MKNSRMGQRRQNVSSRSFVSSLLQAGKKVANQVVKPDKLSARRIVAIVSPFADAFFAKLEKIIGDDLLLSVALLFLPVIYMLAALSLITNIGLGKWVLPTGLLLWAASVISLHREERWQKIVAHLLLFLGVFALFALVASQMLDIHWDSRTYHYAAVQMLLDGVNPFYEPLNWSPLAYPTAYWLLSSSMVLWTNSIEASSALTAPAILVAFICSWRFIASFKGINRTWRLLLAVLLAANPIAIWTLITHHVDGMLVSTMLSSFMLMLLFVSQGKKTPQTLQKAQRTKTRRYYIHIAISLILLINIKFTGLVFGAILGLTALAYGIAVNGNSKQTRGRLRQLVGIGTIASMLAVIFFGFFPYATNTIHKKNPFHSVNRYDEQGNKVSNVVQILLEPEFHDRSYYEKWWISLFSKNKKNSRDPAPLPPFSSIIPFSFLSGFGSIFSGAMLLCLTLVLFIRNKAAWIIISGVFASIFITEAGFYSRLTPQNWWIPIMILVFFLAQEGKAKRKFFPIPKAPKIMAVFISICLLQPPSIFLHFAKEAIIVKGKVTSLQKQGGWYVTKDKDLQHEYQRIAFFRYYASGLTGVRLPELEECPENAQQQKVHHGLTLCRP